MDRCSKRIVSILLCLFMLVPMAVRANESDAVNLEAVTKNKKQASENVDAINLANQSNRIAFSTKLLNKNREADGLGQNEYMLRQEIALRVDYTIYRKLNSSMQDLKKDDYIFVELSENLVLDRISSELSNFPRYEKCSNNEGKNLYKLFYDGDHSSIKGYFVIYAHNENVHEKKTSLPNEFITVANIITPITIVYQDTSIGGSDFIVKDILTQFEGNTFSYVGHVPLENGYLNNSKLLLSYATKNEPQRIKVRLILNREHRHMQDAYIVDEIPNVPGIKFLGNVEVYYKDINPFELYLKNDQNNYAYYKYYYDIEEQERARHSPEDYIHKMNTIQFDQDGNHLRFHVWHEGGARPDETVISYELKLPKGYSDYFCTETFATLNTIPNADSSEVIHEKTGLDLIPASNSGHEGISVVKRALTDTVKVTPEKDQTIDYEIHTTSIYSQNYNGDNGNAQFSIEDQLPKGMEFLGIKSGDGVTAEYDKNSNKVTFTTSINDANAVRKFVFSVRVNDMPDDKPIVNQIGESVAVVYKELKSKPVNTKLKIKALKTINGGLPDRAFDFVLKPTSGLSSISSSNNYFGEVQFEDDRFSYDNFKNQNEVIYELYEKCDSENCYKNMVYDKTVYEIKVKPYLKEDKPDFEISYRVKDAKKPQEFVLVNGSDENTPFKFDNKLNNANSLVISTKFTGDFKDLPEDVKKQITIQIKGKAEFSPIYSYDEFKDREIVLHDLKNGLYTIEFNHPELPKTMIRNNQQFIDDVKFDHETIEVELQKGNQKKIEFQNDYKNLLYSKQDINLRVLWDGKNQYKLTVKLLQNGKDYKTHSFNTDDKEESFIFKDCPRYDENGKVIEYSVEYNKCDQYESTVSKDETKGFTIVNSEIPVCISYEFNCTCNQHELCDDIVCRRPENNKDYIGSTLELMKFDDISLKNGTWHFDHWEVNDEKVDQNITKVHISRNMKIKGLWKFEELEKKESNTSEESEEKPSAGQTQDPVTNPSTNDQNNSTSGQNADKETGKSDVETTTDNGKEDQHEGSSTSQGGQVNQDGSEKDQNVKEEQNTETDGKPDNKTDVDNSDKTNGNSNSDSKEPEGSVEQDKSQDKDDSNKGEENKSKDKNDNSNSSHLGDEETETNKVPVDEVIQPSVYPSVESKPSFDYDLSDKNVSNKTSMSENKEEKIEEKNQTSTNVERIEEALSSSVKDIVGTGDSCKNELFVWLLFCSCISIVMCVSVLKLKKQ